jgi:hypothetical protein
MNLTYRVKAYAGGAKILSEWLGDDGICVDGTTAQDRAGVCHLCPMNKPGWVAPEKVAEAIRSQLELKNNMEIRVQGEKALHTCSVCLCPLKLKIHMPIGMITKYMTKDQFNEYPTRCWLRQETNL